MLVLVLNAILFFPEKFIQNKDWGQTRKSLDDGFVKFNNEWSRGRRRSLPLITWGSISSSSSPCPRSAAARASSSSPSWAALQKAHWCWCLAWLTFRCICTSTFSAISDLHCFQYCCACHLKGLSRLFWHFPLAWKRRLQFYTFNPAACLPPHHTCSPQASLGIPPDHPSPANISAKYCYKICMEIIKQKVIVNPSRPPLASASLQTIFFSSVRNSGGNMERKGSQI